MKILYKSTAGTKFLKLPENREKIEKSAAVTKTVTQIIEPEQVDKNGTVTKEAVTEQIEEIVTPAIYRDETDGELVARLMPASTIWMPQPDQLPDNFEVDWNAMKIVAVPAPPLVVTIEMVKMEAGRRIRAVLKDDATQRNMNALAADLVDDKVDGLITPQGQDILTVLKKSLQWVKLVQESGRTIPVDENYKNDNLWPKVPAGLADLVSQL